MSRRNLYINFLNLRGMALDTRCTYPMISLGVFAHRLYLGRRDRQRVDSSTEKGEDTLSKKLSYLLVSDDTYATILDMSSSSIWKCGRATGKYNLHHLKHAILPIS